MLLLSPELKAFIADHESEDTDKLLLSAQRYPAVDMPFVADQILARRQIREKLPAWYSNRDLIYPSRISAEQCSSEVTALYKQSLLQGKRVCDLTGGLGVDSWAFSQKAEQVTYIERFPDYCAAAANNFKALQASNIRILQGDCREIAGSLTADTFYLDPARRSEGNKRLFALNDCEPDILQLKTGLLTKAERVILKISPMADLTETIRLLPEVAAIHIIAVRNECKEILLLLERQGSNISPVEITTVNFDTTAQKQIFSFLWEEEKAEDYRVTNRIKEYLYEPNAAILKSGAFKLLSKRYLLEKLHQHSHLYTSTGLIRNFPGRIFTVEQLYDFSGKKLKQLGKAIPKANITVRNFPLTVKDIRKNSGIAEGGNIYLFATTLSNARHVLIACKKAIL